MPHTRILTVIEVTASSLLAGGAITTHFWLPSLKEVSDIAAQVLPLLGVPLVIMQLIVYARRIWRRGR